MAAKERLDCFVAYAPRNDGKRRRLVNVHVNVPGIPPFSPLP